MPPVIFGKTIRRVFAPGRTDIVVFAGTSHGEAGTKLVGRDFWPNFELWLQLADASMQDVYAKRDA